MFDRNKGAAAGLAIRTAATQALHMRRNDTTYMPEGCSRVMTTLGGIRTEACFFTGKSFFFGRVTFFW